MQYQAALLLLLLSTPVSAMADAHSYTCEVAHVYNLSEDGSLKTSTFAKEMRGSIFTVSRDTGEIIGKVVPTLMAKSTSVINKGSNKNSFKAIADFGEQYQLIEVQEFRQGTVKPFFTSSMGGAGIVTGLCK